MKQEPDTVSHPMVSRDSGKAEYSIFLQIMVDIRLKNNLKRKTKNPIEKETTPS